jgi:hypothetical protein
MGYHRVAADQPAHDRFHRRRALIGAAAFDRVVDNQVWGVAHRDDGLVAAVIVGGEVTVG